MFTTFISEMHVESQWPWPIQGHKIIYLSMDGKILHFRYYVQSWVMIVV